LFEHGHRSYDTHFAPRFTRISRDAGLGRSASVEGGAQPLDAIAFEADDDEAAQVVPRGKDEPLLLESAPIRAGAPP